MRELAGGASSAVELALLDTNGVIVSVNNAWRAFGAQNGGDVARTGVGVSYLDICDGAADEGSNAVGTSIRAALAGELPAPVVVTIPCDAPGVPRCFDVLISSRLGDDGRCVGATVTLSAVRSPDPDREAGQHAELAIPPGRSGARTKTESDLAARMDERERIAAYLNTQVMSELFAIGMGLQGMVEGLVRPEDKFRLSRYIEGMDTLVRDLRTTVFELGPSTPARVGLKRRLLEVIDEHRGTRELSTEVQFSGALDAKMGTDLEDIVVEVVTAALASLVMRSRSSSVSIAVSLSADLLAVEVAHYGTGLAAVDLETVLPDLKRYADRFGGGVQLTTSGAGHTLLRWTARVLDR